MHKIGYNVIKKTLIMSDNQRGIILCLQFIDTLGYDPQGVDVESGIRFVQDG